MKQIIKKFQYFILGILCCGLIVACNNTSTVEIILPTPQKVMDVLVLVLPSEREL